MQACHYSVAEGKKRSIVVSARMFWFIELETAADNLVLHYTCKVKISRAYVVGSSSFMRTLVAFLLCTWTGDHTLNASELRAWDLALGRAPGGAAAGARTPTRGRNWFRAPMGRGGGGGRKPASHHGKRHRKSVQGGNSKTSRSVVVSVDDDDDDDSDKPAAMDKYGVIPWFDQIDKTHARVLGVGRAGKVTQVKWMGKDVALKTFSLQHDDKRNLHNVYQHELDVLHSLHSLWGTHVPALLFHKPWATGPMIGLQLGEQLPDDMSKWLKQDCKSAMDAMKKINDLGWEQEDMRGANFVRLTGADGVVRIAMINFESCFCCHRK
jgi:hypothetical protein